MSPYFPTDAVACRARVGIPIWSNWSGALIDCKPLPARQEPQP